MTDADVVVIGGGVTGLGVARDLTMRGVDVTLCERGRLGRGASVNSHGLLHSGARYAGADPAAAADCARENRVLRRIAGACVDPTGGLLAALRDDDPAWFPDRADACRRAGVPTTAVGPTDVRDAVPQLTDAVERALRVPDAVIDRRGLVAATAADAHTRGARILTDAPVVDVTVGDGRVTGVTVDGGRERTAPTETPQDGPEGRTHLPADHVVNAAGAWAGRVAELAGATCGMAPTVGTMVTVDASLATVLNRCRPPSDGDIVVPAPEGQGAILGTTSEPAGDPDAPPAEPAAVERLREACGALFPPARSAPLRTVYRGLRPLPEGTDGGGTDDTLSGSRDASRGAVVIDHAEDGRPGLTSIVGGKLTTHRAMAARVADSVADRLDVGGHAPTGVRRLPPDDPDALPELVAAFGVADPSGDPAEPA